MDLRAETRGRHARLWCAAPRRAAAACAPADCVGYAVTQRSSLVLNIAKVAVASHSRRRGVGRALVERAIAEGREGRAQLVRLHVDATNVAAIALYRSAGFEPVATREDYYSVGRHAIAMELPIDGPVGC